MNVDARLNELAEKLDTLIDQFGVLKHENISLKRSVEERDQELSSLRNEIEKLGSERKEAARRLDAILSKISQYTGEKGSEALL